jgi:hypothetical protein
MELASNDPAFDVEGESQPSAFAPSPILTIQPYPIVSPTLSPNVAPKSSRSYEAQAESQAPSLLQGDDDLGDDWVT